MIGSMAYRAGAGSSSYWNQLNQEPVDVESQVMNFQPVVDTTLLPLKVSYEWNKWRNLWHITNSIGMGPGSSLKDPFSHKSFQRRAASRYNAFTVRGLMGDALNLTNVRTPGEYLADREKYGAIGALFKQDPDRNITRPWIKGMVYDSGREEDFIKAAGPGFLEKTIISKKSFASTMSKVHPGIIDTLGGDDKAYDKFISYLTSKNADTVDSSTVRKIQRYHQSKIISPMNLITGKHQGVEMGRMNMIQEIFSTDIQNHKFGLTRWQRGLDTKAQAHFANAMHNFIENNKVVPPDMNIGKSTIPKYPYIVSSGRPGMSREIMDASEQMVGRLKRARLLKTAGLAMAGAEIAMALTKATANAVMSIPGRVTPTIRQITRNDFGSGEVLQNSALATERQRALRAIQESQLNARHLMGNEARYMH